jgi:CheY-like chemotaxis protein
MLNFDARHTLPTLLLIDDDLVSREVTATVLIMNGYSVYTAENGESATELLDSEKCAPDVILMDAQMPGLSGVELIAALRRRIKAYIYAISASRLPPELAEAADGFLQKPFDAAALTRLLERRTPNEFLRDAELLEQSEPVINPDTLAQLRGMMSPTAVKEIYAAVVADLYKRMNALEEAIGRNDTAEIRRVGHAIKGGCGMAGVMQAAQIGASFEALPPTPDGNQLDNNRALLRDLRAATERLERMLEAEFSV